MRTSHGHWTGVLAAAGIGAIGSSGTLVDESIERARTLSHEVTITRDEFGVPHVHAKTDAGAVFGGMFARAEDEMARIESGHAASIGMASLMYGAAGLTTDRFILSYDVPERARREFETSPADVRALSVAAADALNYYQSLHPAYHPRAIERWEPWMFHAREYAWGLYMAQKELERLGRELAAKGAPAPELAPEDEEVVPEPEGAERPEPRKTPDGSNAWAIGPSRTKSGRAMLYLNPHIPLDEVYEIHLRSDEGLNISGMVAYGADLTPSLGFNEHLGWSLTVNYPDIADTYAIRFDIPGDPLAYKHGDKVLHATRWTSTVRVREGEQVREQELVFIKTIHGPVLYQTGGVAYAVRTANIENLRAIEQWYRMARASTLDEWKIAVSSFSVVFHNFVYADANGNIGYLYNAAFPKRDPALNWAGTLDGSDPRADWQGYRTLDELPQVWNPAAGYVLSCNSPPFVATAEGQGPDRSKFPADMIGTDLSDGRIEMSHDILSHAAAWTLDDLERAAFDTRVYWLDKGRDPLLKDYTRLRETDAAKAEHLAPVIDLIREWDGRLSLESEVGTVFMLWLEKIFAPSWATRRSAGDLSAALAETMTELERDFGSWRVKWGEINRHQRFDTGTGVTTSDDRESFPIVGGHGSFGVSFCYLARGAGGKRRYGYHGHSYVGAVEFGDTPSARSIVPFGTSRDPASAHYADQAPIYAAGRLKAVRFAPQEVTKNARRTYHPGT